VTELKFFSNGGRKAQTEARRYVYNVLWMMLEHELNPDERDGWMFGGIEHDADKRRLTKAIRVVMAELSRKGQR